MKVIIVDVFVVEQPWAPNVGQGGCDGREGEAGWKSVIYISQHPQLGCFGMFGPDVHGWGLSTRTARLRQCCELRNSKDTPHLDPRKIERKRIKRPRSSAEARLLCPRDRERHLGLKIVWCTTPIAGLAWHGTRGRWWQIETYWKMPMRSW